MSRATFVPVLVWCWGTFVVIGVVSALDMRDATSKLVQSPIIMCHPQTIERHRTTTSTTCTSTTFVPNCRQRQRQGWAHIRYVVFSFFTYYFFFTKGFLTTRLRIYGTETTMIDEQTADTSQSRCVFFLVFLKLFLRTLQLDVANDDGRGSSTHQVCCFFFPYLIFISLLKDFWQPDYIYGWKPWWWRTDSRHVTIKACLFLSCFLTLLKDSLQLADAFFGTSSMRQSITAFPTQLFWLWKTWIR
jgi:hypothetical protein